jgi:hypothetical protein
MQRVLATNPPACARNGQDGDNIETAEFTGKDGSKIFYRKLNGTGLVVEEHNSVPVDLYTMKPDLLSKP